MSVFAVTAVTDRTVYLLSFVLSFVSVWGTETYHDTMERQCGGIIQLTSLPTQSLVLVLTEQIEYKPRYDCQVTVVASEEARIFLSFLELDIPSFDACVDDFLLIADSEPLLEHALRFQDSKVRRYCGTVRPKPMTTTGNNVSIHFVSDANLNGKGFSILLTAFHKAKCDEEEFRCKNDRCIDIRLKCDDYDNCGDGSDNCDIPVYIITGIAVASSLSLLAGLFLVVVIRYRCQQKQFESEENTHEDHTYESSTQIHSIVVDPVRCEAVARSVSSFLSSLVQVPTFPQTLVPRPPYLPGLPCRNTRLVST
ncbi:hypothetical protein RRG08_048890 [Elysia crispata]|uniref:CUB domain-containing protein n=1 Tax=Elysia crispata TaxID=231223 RepID=A0AAE0YT72_9GAST|nr:hypothetical protein RRG08_048890 [Elysia crispata]